jgi:hypothetical protein
VIEEIVDIPAVVIQDTPVAEQTSETKE